MSYSDKYWNMFQNCLKSTNDKHGDLIQLYTIFMFNLLDIKPKYTHLFSKLFVYLWKHNKKFAEHIMYSIIDSDDTQYLNLCDEFEWIIYSAVQENISYEERCYMYQTFTGFMCRKLKKDWDNYILGLSHNISDCTLWFIRKNRNGIFKFKDCIFNDCGKYNFDNESYISHFIKNNSNLIYEMCKNACDKKIDDIDFDNEWQIMMGEPWAEWEELLTNLNKNSYNYPQLIMVLKNVFGLLYNNNEIIVAPNKPQITKPVIFDTIDECYSLIMFANEYINTIHENNIFTILPKEIIMKIIISSCYKDIKNINLNFFYPK